METTIIWTDAVAAFREDLRELERSKHTIQSYANDLKLFARWHNEALSEDPTIDGISAATLRDFKEALVKNGAAVKTVNRKLTALQSFLRFGESRGWNGPVRSPRSMRETPPRPRWLTRREELALLRTVARRKRKRDVALIALMLGAGLRVEEVSSLDWTMLEISPRKGQVKVVGKGRKERTIPLHVDVRDALIKHRATSRSTGAVFGGRGERLTRNAIGRIVSRYGWETKLDKLSPHVLRHTFCRRLAEMNVRLEDIAALAGHESIETTRLYVEPGQDDLRVAVERLAGGEE